MLIIDYIDNYCKQYYSSNSTAMRSNKRWRYTLEEDLYMVNTMKMIGLVVLALVTFNVVHANPLEIKQIQEASTGWNGSPLPSYQVGETQLRVVSFDRERSFNCVSIKLPQLQI